MLKGLLRAIAFIHDPRMRPAVTQMLARGLRVNDRGGEEAYLELLEGLERKPYPSAEGLRNVEG